MLAQRAMNGFLRYLEREQARSEIPAHQRVVLEVVRQPNKVVLLKGRPEDTPIVIFLAVLLATFGIAFMLENLRPRLQRCRAAKSVSPRCQGAGAVEPPEANENGRTGPRTDTGGAARSSPALR